MYGEMDKAFNSSSAKSNFSSNKNTSNDIKDGKTKQLAVDDEQADSSEVSENVTNLEMVVCAANETYFVLSLKDSYMYSPLFE